MSKFKVGDWVVPRNSDEFAFLARLDWEVNPWPTQVLAATPGGSYYNFVEYKGCKIPRSSERFKLAPPEKSLDEYM